MNESASEREAKPPREVAVSLSQFAAQVLGQLRLSAWLPGATLVGALYLLALLKTAEDEADSAFSSVFEAIQTTDITTIILLVLSTAVVTTAMQAFAFGAIRLLEGYWGSSYLAIVGFRVGTAVQRVQRQHFENVLVRTMRKAVRRAADDLALSQSEEQTLIAVMEGRDLRPFTQEEIHRADKVNIEQHTCAATARRIDAVNKRLLEYPIDPIQIMPTRIGNIIRAGERRAFPENEIMEIAVVRRFDVLPLSIRLQHDEARNQLDLYGLLVGLSVLIGVIGVVVLGDTSPVAIGWAGSSLVGAVLNYRAMVASAKSYSSAILAIGAYDIPDDSSAAKRPFASRLNRARARIERLGRP